MDTTTGTAMGASEWISLIISLLLAGVGLYMTHRTDVTLARIEEQNRKFDETMRLFVDKLVDTQIRLLLPSSPAEVEQGEPHEENQIVKQAEKLKAEILSNRQSS